MRALLKSTQGQKFCRVKYFVVVFEACFVAHGLEEQRFLAKSLHSRPGCSKLTTSLVKASLKFQTLIHVSQIRQNIFLLKKCEKLLHCNSFSIFFNKNIIVFGYIVEKHLTS